MIQQRSIGVLALTYAPLLLYGLVVLFLAALAPQFLSVANFLNILVLASPVAIAAIGMTFVLISAGIDLSVGSTMFLAGAIAGRLVVDAGWPVVGVIPVMLAVGLGVGLLNGWLIARLKLVPFMVTLATLFSARGAGLWITETRAINLPDSFRQLAVVHPLGIPLPILILVVVLLTAETVLRRTVLGKHLYALGYNAQGDEHENGREAAKAGIDISAVLLRVYAIAGLCAAVGSIITLAQLAAVSPNLGQGIELEIIAATVLGGTSLFGGRGTAGGAVLGALLVETVRNGLNLVNADPYFYPLITGAIIFGAVLLDSMRQQRLTLLRHRNIRIPKAIG